MSKLITKIAALQAKKPNSFNVDFKGLRLVGEKMTNVDLTTDAAKITFTYDGVNYELLKADITIVKRLRTKKYLFKTNVLTAVV